VNNWAAARAPARDNRRMPKRPLLAATLLLAAAAIAAAPPKKTAPEPDPAGTVTRVVDGDTLWVMTADPKAAPLVVRLEGIDAPERCQGGGPEAAEAMTKIALGRQVVLKVKARDTHGRLVARALRDGEFDLGDRLVRDGHAWSARYRFDRGPYVAQERMAAALKRGVHADAAALLPAEFRRRHGPCELSAAVAPK
jgi:micrococcal nuclease